MSLALPYRNVSSELQSPINDPAHWRNRANEARIVLQISDPQARMMMLVIAANYQWLAQRVEEGWRSDQ
jgi:hypothetical protein